MSIFTEVQRKGAKTFATFYFDLIDNHRETLLCHLSDSATLDWFGRTICGASKIADFLRYTIGELHHQFRNVEPCPTIGYRETHSLVHLLPSLAAPVSVRGVTVRERRPDTPAVVPEEKTPPNQPSCSRKRDRDEGDCVVAHSASLTASPPKRTRVVVRQVDAPIPISFLTCAGHVEFRSTSMKKLQKETKWSRPCKFQVAYSSTPTGYVIHLLIYQGNMRCKRNLMKEFDAVSKKESVE